VTFTYAPIRDDERGRVTDILSHAFALPPADAGPWFERAKLENVHVLRREAAVVGALLEIPMGQYFGGRAVPMMGVAGVAIVPEERGAGAATALMRSMLEKARGRGFAISCLYPATHTLYRRVGYEVAGSRFSVSYDPRAQDVPRVRDVLLRESDGLPEEARALYMRLARHVPGALERGPYIWVRLEKPRGYADAKAFLVYRAQRLEGYVSFAHIGAAGATQILVFDLCAETVEAARAIVRFLGEYRSLASRVTWYGPSADVFTHVLPERFFDVAVEGSFMLRVIDPARAFASRGYPRLADGSLTFAIEDATFGASTHRVTVADGGATVGAASGAPDVRLAERGLAALYSGFHPAGVLRALGELDADDASIERLESWFSGPLPTMREHF